MNTVDHLCHLVGYNRWANERALTALRGSESDRAVQIFAHLLVTEGEYLRRLNGEDSTGYDFWPDLALTDCGRLVAENTWSYSELLQGSNEADLDRIIEYKNSSGKQFTNTLRELITHVLLHSSIHRGNIVITLRGAGFDPPHIDYILYLREP